jgi:hypothetical protein
MPFFKDGLDYYYLNVLVFLANILLGYYHRRPVLVVASVVCLAVLIYIQGEDPLHPHVFLLNQVAMLGVLIPGILLWIQSKPSEHIFAGLFFLVAALLYACGFLMKIFGHSPEQTTREYWALVMHLFTTGGHLALLFEPAVLYGITKRV